jgi:hypothetical protein
MGRTINGFGVRGQGRTSLRKDLTGLYRGYKWFVMGEGTHRFRWCLGPMGGFVSGPKTTLYDALAAMQGVYRKLTRLRNLYGEAAVKQAACELELLLKWEQAAATGRLEIKSKVSGGETVFSVRVLKVERTQPADR